METSTERDFIDPTETESGIQYDEKKTDPNDPLTDWKNEPKIGDLKTDLTEVGSHHDGHVANINKWLDNLYVRGKAKPPKRTGYSEVQPQVIRKQAEWRYAALSEPFLSTDDLFTASPVTYEDKVAAEQNGLVLNAQFRKDVDRVRFIDQYVRTAVNEGTAILRTGWEFAEETVMEDVPVYGYQQDDSPQAGQMMNALAEEFQQNPEVFQAVVPQELQTALNMTLEQGVVTVPYVKETKQEEVTNTLVNRPTVEVCNYNDVMIDPTCKGDIDKANFVIYRFPTSLSLLKKEGKYKNLDSINTSNQSILAMPDDTETDDKGNFTFTDEPRRQFYAYEYWGFWDTNNDGILQPIVATFVDGVIIRMEDNPFPDKKVPFEVVQYLPLKDSLYGEPDGVLIEDNQKIVGAVTRGMIDIMARSANGQIGSAKDALDPINKRRFDRGEDYEFNPGITPANAFHTHTYPEIPNAAQYMLNLQNVEAESLTGVKAFSGGLSGDALGEGSAASVRGALDAASKRELGILRRLADGIIKVGRKFTSMNSEWLSEEEVIRITNDKFVKVKRHDLSGEIDIRLNITTAEEDNQKAQELAFMLQTMGNTLPPEMSQILLSDLAKLRKMPEMAQKIETFVPQPDPMAVRIQELEIAKLEAEIAKINSESFENQAGGEADLAKARNLDSDTDNKDLGFVEQESGTAHARDVDKITSQAKAQTEKSIVESTLPGAQTAAG